MRIRDDGPARFGKAEYETNTPSESLVKDGGDLRAVRLAEYSDIICDCIRQQFSTSRPFSDYNTKKLGLFSVKTNRRCLCIDAFFDIRVGEGYTARTGSHGLVNHFTVRSERDRDEIIERVSRFLEGENILICRSAYSLSGYYSSRHRRLYIRRFSKPTVSNVLSCFGRGNSTHCSMALFLAL